MIVAVIRAFIIDKIEGHTGPGLAITMAIRDALLTAFTLNPTILP